MSLLAGGIDYEEIIALNFDVFLTFNNENHQQSFNVTIIDDPLFELNVENFTLELIFDPFYPTSNVILNPNISAIEILDDDGEIRSTFIM